MQLARYIDRQLCADAGAQNRSLARALNIRHIPHTITATRGGRLRELRYNTICPINHTHLCIVTLIIQTPY